MICSTRAPYSSHGPCGEGRETGSRVALVGLLIAALLLTIVIVLLVLVSPARAITDSEELVRFGSEGHNAGQVGLPAGLATDPTTGHVYVGGIGGNNRIEEFTAWGEFVKAFGWDVAPGAVSEEQEVRVRAAAGQFKLTFGVSTTTDLAFDASAAQVEGALNGLSAIGEGGGNVSVREVVGNPDGSIPYVYVVMFKGSLGGKDVAQMSASNGATPLSGGSPTTSLEVRTRADGAPSGSGLESCTTASGCQKGSAGSGAGQIGNTFSVAVDQSGDIYVSQPELHRVQKFSSSGRFLLMFGGQVDKTEVAKREEQEAKAEPVTVTSEEEDVCTDVSGDQCGAGIEGSARGQFNDNDCLDVAVGADGTVFVCGKERIEEFEADGHYKSEIALPGKAVGSFVRDLTSDAFYIFGGNPSEENVSKLNPVGASIGTLAVKIPNALATDQSGNVYVVAREERDGSIFINPERVLEFDADGGLIANELAVPEQTGLSPIEHFSLYALGTNAVGDLYVANDSPPTGKSFVRTFGPAPVMFESPPQVPPVIGAEYAGSVDATDATVHVQINPRFWSDTSYYVEYGAEACDASVCARQPAASGLRLTSKVTDLPVTGTEVIGGLQPGTTYHYRFVALSGGGGPVFGPDRTFRTFREAVGSAAGCSNEVFRTGLSGLLADCRAYEMVSPVEKNNGDITNLINLTGYQTAIDQSADSGNEMTYTSYRAFGDAQSAPWAAQYLARRDAQAGWVSEAISPPQGVGAQIGVESYDVFDNDYRFFSAELGSGWLQLQTQPPLAPGGVENSPGLYRRDNHTGGYETLMSVEPAFTEPPFNGVGKAEPELQDVAEDGVHAVFRINAKLTAGASGGYYNVYESGGSALRPVCVLPSGAPATESCSAGTAIDSATDTGTNRLNSVYHAISSDGSRVYWTASPSVAGREGDPLGMLYLRENAEQDQSVVSGGQCTEPALACTVAVSQTGVKARFLDASVNGSEALYEVEDGASSLNGNLYLFDSESEGAPRLLVAKGTVGVLGASDDLSYVYFVSTEAIAGTSGAKAKEPNLYLYHEGAYSFIATLTSTDVREGSLYHTSDTTPELIFKTARVTPDGRRVVFNSTASLTGYDNVDAVSGVPDFEVFTYEAGSSGPVCVSCDPSGARPTGREAQQAGGSFAATIPPWETQFYAPRVISDDGSRVFFDSYDALTPRDTNGVEDVYEWEIAGAGDCTVNDPSYSAADAGCVSLISSGDSAQDSEFRDASASGDGVFFTTQSSLAAQDTGLIDMYDARVDGGFAVSGSPAGCEGEACQNPPVPPIEITPASLTFSGSGNIASSPPPVIASTKPKAKALTPAQKLARALKVCRAKSKSKRSRCEAQARKRYGRAKRATRARKGVH